MGDAWALLDIANTEIAKLKEEIDERDRDYEQVQAQLAGAQTENRELRQIIDDSELCWMQSRCPCCGHYLRQDLPASGCPQCGVSFKAPWHYNDGDYPNDCECERCVGIRAGTVQWTDPFAAMDKEDDGSDG